jgi:hypothetical protein
MAPRASKTLRAGQSRREWRLGSRLCLVAVVSLSCRSAYTAWKPVPDATLRESESRQFKKLLVITRDGHELELGPAALVGDSLVGTSTGGGQAGVAKGQHVALLRSQVARLESSELSAQPAGDAAKDVGKGAAAGLGCVLTLFRICK